MTERDTNAERMTLSATLMHPSKAPCTWPREFGVEFGEVRVSDSTDALDIPDVPELRG